MLSKRSETRKTSTQRTRSLSLPISTPFQLINVMAVNRMAVVALLLISMLVASSAPAAMAAGGGCFNECFGRCSNGKNNPACATMCAQACIVPKTLPDGSDPSSIVTGK